MPPFTLPQWNLALINALFLMPDKVSTTISRIDVTGRALAALSGGQDLVSAKHGFIKSFGNDPSVIKDQFISSPRIAILTERDGVPPNFAALYLSLLAASADDDTFQEGRFRIRFAALLGLDELKTFEFNDLPKLWEQFALWSRSRAASARDCAVLILPDPQRETLIGYAKRLAFPSFRDEIWLRKALDASDVDSRDPFAVVSRAAHKWIGKYSKAFKEELREFHLNSYEGRLQQAYDSPFWGAVRDITIEEDEKERAQFGRLCAQIDSTDPQFPELIVFADEQASVAFSDEQTVRLPRARGLYVATLVRSSLKTSIATLLSITAKDRGKAFARSKLSLGLRAGCLPFFWDAFEDLSSDGSYFENGPCCLLIQSIEVVQRIKSLTIHTGSSYAQMGAQTSDGEWTFLYFPELSRPLMDRLLLEVPDGARKLFIQAWVPERPRISGVARYGQAIL